MGKQNTGKQNSHNYAFFAIVNCVQASNFGEMVVDAVVVCPTSPVLRPYARLPFSPSSWLRLLQGIEYVRRDR